MEPKTITVVFTPENEPYLGRQLLFQFDQLIFFAMKQNNDAAPASHGRNLTDHQHMACQVIAQAISITLSIRELIRQGYLFGGHVLLRALVERAAILLYLPFLPDGDRTMEAGLGTQRCPFPPPLFSRPAGFSAIIFPSNP